MSVQVEGDWDAPILVVTDAPTRDDLMNERPLSCGYGKLFWAMLKKTTGYNRKDCLVLNTIGEAPEGRDYEPTKEQLHKYWDDFNQAIERSHARVVVCLGRTAFWRTTGITGGIESWRGYLVSPNACQNHVRKVEEEREYKTANKKKGIKKGDKRIVRVSSTEKAKVPETTTWILPTIHPRTVTRSGFTNLAAFNADLARVGRAVEEKLELPRTEASYSPRDIRGEDMLAVDIETVMGSEQIVRIGFANRTNAWSAKFDRNAELWTRRLLEDPDSVKVFHNSAFDVMMLEKNGFAINGPIWDTMLAAQLEQPDLYKGLNAVTSLYLDRERHKHLSEEQPAYYNAQDVIVTAQLYDILKGNLKENGQLELFEGTIMPATREFMHMKRRGIMVDMARRDLWMKELENEMKEALVEWHRYTPTPLTSPQQLANYLYKERGYVVQYGKYGGWTTDAGAIRTLSELYPEDRAIFDCILRFKTAHKLSSVYAKQSVADDGCVHPSYLPASKDYEYKDTEGVNTFSKGMAGTGRPTARDPNIQNQPPESRRIFMARPGMVFLEGDYSQIELRIAAALSGDRELQDALRGDVHERTQQLLGVDRTRAKNVMYGTLYGAGPKRLAAVLNARGYNVTQKECKELQDKLAKAYPALWAWMQFIVATVGAEYALRNPFGRRRAFLQGAKDAPAARDYLPQSTAADIIWNRVVPIARAMESVGGWEDALVHDSALVEVPASKMLDGAFALKDVMEVEFPNIAPGFRVPINVKWGTHWGPEMQELKL